MPNETQSEIEIKQFKPPDEDALLSFLRRAYPGEPRKSDRAFWRWQFMENPHTDPEDAPLWVVKRGDEIVGQMAAIPIELKVGGEQKRALWIVDYIVYPEYRGQRVGKRMLEIPHQSYCKTLLALGYNKNAEKPMRSLNWELLGNINRYQILLFPGDATRELSRVGAVRKMANLCYAPFRPGSSRLAPKGKGAVSVVTSFDSSFDALWREASAQWTCAVVRGSRFLEWQYMRQPGKKFDVLGYQEDGRLRGYVVLFFRAREENGRIPKASITDLCYSPAGAQEVIDELLKAALRLAIERRAGSLVTDVLDPRVEGRLRHFGFWGIKSSPPFAANVLESADLIYDLSNWFLTRGDSDVSIFEEPNL